MNGTAPFDNIDLHLVRVLHTLISERSVSRAAMRLSSSQPAVSAQLKRLRTLTGDPLLVRAGQQMQPTEVALQLVGPAENLLQEAERLFGQCARALPFDASRSTAIFRVAASDYLDPLFLPALVTRIKQLAPNAILDLMPLTQNYDYRRRLADGDVDLVVGNWLEPPGELHLGHLISDDVVCLVAEKHPMAAAEWDVDRYLSCEHVAPTPMSPGAQGVIDEHLARQGISRRISVRSAHFSLIPLMVAGSLLVLTTGRMFCARYVDQLPVRIVKCPVAFPTLNYYQLWHERTHTAPPMRWFREQVREVANRVEGRAMPSRFV